MEALYRLGIPFKMPGPPRPVIIEQIMTQVDNWDVTTFGDPRPQFLTNRRVELRVHE